ncbi:MAG TPA: hypothetical protein VFG47_03815 [Geminicoccaceae bacterium]|nr:hypothetical protein [Geminicoccaceae bacterium]
MGQFLVGVLLGLLAGLVAAWCYHRRGAGAGVAAVPAPAVPELDRPGQAGRAEGERERLRAGLAGAERRAADLEGQLEAARRRSAELEERAARLEQELARLAAASGPVDTTAPRPPAGLPAPDGLPDDLKLISGIGPRIEQTLNRLGIFHFRQVAALTPGNAAWINQHLRFRGRIERERWIEQARVLAAGGQTEFSRRYHRLRRQQQQHRPARP